MSVNHLVNAGRSLISKQSRLGFGASFVAGDPTAPNLILIYGGIFRKETAWAKAAMQLILHADLLRDRDSAIAFADFTPDEDTPEPVWTNRIMTGINDSQRRRANEWRRKLRDDERIKVAIHVSESEDPDTRGLLLDAGGSDTLHNAYDYLLGGAVVVGLVEEEKKLGYETIAPYVFGPQTTNIEAIYAPLPDEHSQAGYSLLSLVLGLDYMKTKRVLDRQRRKRRVLRVIGNMKGDMNVVWKMNEGNVDFAHVDEGEEVAIGENGEKLYSPATGTLVLTNQTLQKGNPSPMAFICAEESTTEYYTLMPQGLVL